MSKINVPKQKNNSTMNLCLILQNVKFTLNAFKIPIDLRNLVQLMEQLFYDYGSERMGRTG